MDGPRLARFISIGAFLYPVWAWTQAELHPAAAQAPAKNASFEVASVKINKSGDRRSFMRLDMPDRVEFTNQRLDTLISFAYRVPAYKFSGGGADPILSARFDIVAKSERRASTDEKMDMLRTLLEDRFKVRVRTDVAEGDIYALVMARSDGRLGPDIRRSTADCDALTEAIRRGDAPSPPPPKPGERPACGASGSPAMFRAGGMSMSQFANTLGAMMRQTIVDRTGLTGRFDFDLSTSLDRLAPDGPPSIFTALPEQLGLKLERQRGPIETFVIENAELPTPD